jgi:hypothetical protein
MHSQRKQRQSTCQVFYRQIITVLLIIQTILIGIQSKNRLQQGDSTIEVFIWMINQYIPVLKRVRRLEDKEKDDKHKKCDRQSPSDK